MFFFVFVFYLSLFSRSSANKRFVLTTHEKKKVQQIDGMFRGGGGISCSGPQGKTNYCLVLEMKKIVC